MATGTMSSRPLSIIARNTRRPMRPKPLMATLTGMVSILSLLSGPLLARGCAEGIDLDQPDAAESPANSPQFLAHRGRDGLGRDTEVFVKNLIRCRGPEVGHSDEDT